MKNKKFILGLAGHIGSGKSTAAAIFEREGWVWIDADDVIDQLYQIGKPGYEKIKNFFGDDYLLKSGELNRKKLARTVFQDPQKLKILHALIHPLVTAEIKKIIDKSAKKLLVLEATYFEKKFLRSCISRLLWIETSKAKAFERISTSRKMSAELFNKIHRLQVRPEKVDAVIQNNGSKEKLQEEILKFLNKIHVVPFEPDSV